MRRAKDAADALAELSQEHIDAIIDAMAAAVTPQAEALARLAHEETGYGVVADKVQKNLFASEKVYRFIRPMKTVGVVIQRSTIARSSRSPSLSASWPPSSRRRIRRPRRSTKSSSRSRPAARSSLARIRQPSGASREWPRSWARPPRAGRRARRIDRLDDDGHPRRHAGADEGARNRGHPGDRRDGSRSRRLQCRQAGLWRRAGQCAGLHRTHCRPRESRPRHRHRQDVRQRRPLLVGELRRRRRAGRRRGQTAVRRQRRATSCRRPKSTSSESARRAPSDCRIPRWSDGRRRTSPKQAGISVPADDARPDRRAGRRRPRLSALDRKALPRSLLLCRHRLARRLRPVQANPAVWRHGPHHVDPLEERRRHSAVRVEKAGVSASSSIRRRRTARSA